MILNISIFAAGYRQRNGEEDEIYKRFEGWRQSF